MSEFFHPDKRPIQVKNERVTYKGSLYCLQVKIVAIINARKSRINSFCNIFFVSFINLFLVPFSLCFQNSFHFLILLPLGNTEKTCMRLIYIAALLLSMKQEVKNNKYIYGNKNQTKRGYCSRA